MCQNFRVENSKLLPLIPPTIAFSLPHSQILQLPLAWPPSVISYLGAPNKSTTMQHGIPKNLELKTHIIKVVMIGWKGVPPLQVKSSKIDSSCTNSAFGIGKVVRSKHNVD